MDLSFSRRKFDNVVEMIGNTPLVPIRKLNPNPKVEIWAKLEGCNPGGSIKDRIALSMIEAAEEAGQLKPEMTILEATSGNTGIGLALVSAVKGYKLLLTMSEAVSVERRKILAAYGAEFLLTPGDLGTDGAIERAYDLADQHPDRYLLVDQYNNPANPLAHYNGTAPGDLGADRRTGHALRRHTGHDWHRDGLLEAPQGVRARHPGDRGRAPPGSQDSGAQEPERGVRARHLRQAPGGPEDQRG